MAISNRKAGERREPIAEPLKRSVAGCLRAIAKRSEIEVVYASDRPALTGDKARLPEPPRKLTPEDVAILRGNADSMALRLGCHDVAVHRRLAPENAGARAVFDAVEQARVEAIGSRRMLGRQRFFVLRVDPERSAALPILPRRRASARFTGLGAHGYALSGNDLEGGFAALGEALSGTAAWRIPPGLEATR